MCNIAGYIGNRQAAPILVEMLRRQEEFDGCMGTGIVTIHEGKLYYRKLVGSVDDLIKNTDVLDLPAKLKFKVQKAALKRRLFPFLLFSVLYVLSRLQIAWRSWLP